jgi:hypothetical protein
VADGWPFVSPAFESACSPVVAALRRVGSERWRGNLYPTKQRPQQKIDAAVALMMATGRAMAEDGEPDILAFLRDPIFG